jgi:hypothetical protein
MSRFTVRVELHEGTWDDYETLHHEMEQRGFERTITGENGETSHLPTAEYNFSGDIKRGDVLELADAAANKTDRKHGILVTESNGRTWRGLKKI